MDNGELKDAWLKEDDGEIDLDDKAEIGVMLLVLTKHPKIYSTKGMNDI